MKYCYSKILYSLQFVLVAIMGYALIFLVYKSNNDIVFMRKMLLGSTGYFVLMYFMFSKEFFNKSVELDETCAKFNSFRFKSIKMKDPVFFGVKYVDILSIESRRIPLLGVWAIKIHAKNLPQKISVSFCFKNHKKLFAELIKSAKQNNPNVYVDEHLVNYVRLK